MSQHAARSPERPALVLDGKARTYGELDDRSTRLAHAFLALGARDGVVAGMLPNCFEFVEAAVAAGKAAARFLPVNWHLRSDEVRHLLVDSGAAVLVVDAESASAAVNALPDQGGPELVVVGTQYEELVTGSPPYPALASGPTWTPMFYTSGTTGRPKGVVHSGFGPDRAAAAQQGQVALWGWQADDVYLMCGPAYHASHCGWVMTALFVGATTVLMPTWDARSWLSLVQQHGATRSFMVPAHFIRVLEVPEHERATYDLSSLRKVVHGGAPCPVDVKRRFLEAVPAEVWELYGGSEGGATSIGPADWRDHPGSVGRPWPGSEIRVLDESGVPVPDGVTGLVYITPPAGLRFSYHGDEEKTRQAWVGAAFTVGDIGHLDQDGYLFLTDRASDLVIRGGVNIYPREVEEALHAHPGVLDCAVFGVPDQRNGEELVAVVEVRSGTEVAELREHLVDRVARFKVPREIRIVAEVPRDPNGKVLKRLLRAEEPGAAD